MGEPPLSSSLKPIAGGEGIGIRLGAADLGGGGEGRALLDGCDRVNDGRSAGVGRCEINGPSWSRFSERPLDATLGVLAVDPRVPNVGSLSGRSDSGVNACT